MMNCFWFQEYAVDMSTIISYDIFSAIVSGSGGCASVRVIDQDINVLKYAKYRINFLLRVISLLVLESVKSLHVAPAHERAHPASSSSRWQQSVHNISLRHRRRLTSGHRERVCHMAERGVRWAGSLHAYSDRNTARVLKVNITLNALQE